MASRSCCPTAPSTSTSASLPRNPLTTRSRNPHLLSTNPTIPPLLPRPCGPAIPAPWPTLRTPPPCRGYSDIAAAASSSQPPYPATASTAAAAQPPTVYGSHAGVPGTPAPASQHHEPQQKQHHPQHCNAPPQTNQQHQAQQHLHHEAQPQQQQHEQQMPRALPYTFESSSGGVNVTVGANRPGANGGGSNVRNGTVASYEDEYIAVPGTELPLEAQAARLERLLEVVWQAGSDVEEKLRLLRQVDSVVAFLADTRHASVVSALASLSAPHQVLLLALPAMLQQHVLMEPPGAPPSPPAVLVPRLSALASRLARVELFYDSVGGLLGYQLKTLQLIIAGMQEKATRDKTHTTPPPSPSSPSTMISSSTPPTNSSATSTTPPSHPSPPPPPPPSLSNPPSPSSPHANVTFRVPRGIDLAGEEGRGLGVAAAAQGLAALPFTAEIYPVGGAGDRLGLVDELTGESLPAAMLPYAGRTLMEALIRDLQAREYLYFQLTGRQVTTPLAIMTSDAKGNHDRISRLLTDLGWAGRGREAFRLFRQPLVPVVAVEDGRWLLGDPLCPMMKPGGHGVIWKLMWDEGVFEWLTVAHGRRAAIVRQISNPMAGTDTTLLALAGAGFGRRGGGASAFGFMSCERAVGAAEGMNVLAEKKRWVAAGGEASGGVVGASECNAASGECGVGGGNGNGNGRGGPWVYEYGVTNVEYTEFARLGLNDEAVSSDSKTSVFPANTNVLFVGLPGAKKVVAEAISKGDGEQLLPGLIFNLNKKVSYSDPLGGSTRQVTAGRMESTMQNLADFLTDRFDNPLSQEQLASAQLSTFLVSNLRRKVTSSAKKRPTPGSARIAQTPDGSFYDLQRNAWQVLQRCGFRDVPEPGSPEQYMSKGPGFIFLFHPALGPLWDVIAQKVTGGSLTHGSELVLEVAEARIMDLDLDGSLEVYAENVMGHIDHATPDYSNSNIGGGVGHNPSPHPAALHPSPATLALSSLLKSASPVSTAAANMATATTTASGADSTAAGVGGLRGDFKTANVVAGETADMGRLGPEAAAVQPGLLRYSRRCGRVHLVNVRVRNAGIDWSRTDNVYWKHQVSRHETCKIVLLGQSEFEAHDVTITGAQTFIVPDGYRLTVSQAPTTPSDILNGEASLRTVLTPLRPAAAPLHGFEPSWEWQYVMDTSGAVRLSYIGTAPRSAPPAVWGMVATVMAAAERRGQYVLDFSI